MSPDAVFAETQRLGITLSARGDRLHVEAPAGVVTPALRDALARHKLALLARLAPVTEFITLRNGPTLPAPALVLALDLEARGFRLTLDACEHIIVKPDAALTPADRAGIQRWRSALVTVLIPLGFYCLLHGHDVRIRGDRWSLYIECRECGKRSRGIMLRPVGPPAWPPGSAPLSLTSRWIGNAARTIVKITQLLGGLGVPFAHDGHGGA